MWARNFLGELGFVQKDPTILFEDNKSAISLIENIGNGFKTKHIELRYNFIREQVAKNIIRMQYLPTDEMTSDILTKPVGPVTFVHLRKYLLGQ